MWTCTDGNKNNIWASPFCTECKSVLHSVKSLALTCGDLGSVYVRRLICKGKMVPDVQNWKRCRLQMNSPRSKYFGYQGPLLVLPPRTTRCLMQQNQWNTHWNRLYWTSFRIYRIQRTRHHLTISSLPQWDTTWRATLQKFQGSWKMARRMACCENQVVFWHDIDKLA